MGQMGKHGKSQDQLRVAHQPQTEECRPAHASFGVVEESVNSSISQLRRDLLDKEEIGVQPPKIAERFVAGGRGPDMQRNERLL